MRGECNRKIINSMTKKKEKGKKESEKKKKREKLTCPRSLFKRKYFGGTTTTIFLEIKDLKICSIGLSLAEGDK